MIFNDDKLIKLLKNSPNGSELKIFFYIAFNQPQDGIHGYRTTKIQLSIDLNLKIRTIFKSVRWLKDNLLIQELKLVEDSDFMVNPYFMMNNSNRDERIKEWNRRCDIDVAKKIKKIREKRLRELKNKNK